MPTVVLTLGQDGKPRGMTDDDQAHYQRWRRRVQEMKPGDTLSFSWDTPRAPELHRRYFASLSWVFENQEVFTCEREMRKWVERGARHVEVIAGPEGAQFECAKSISYESLDADEFCELYKRAKAFLLSADAIKKLWPAGNVAQAYEALEAALEADQ
jgi:hypothetical protein